MKGIPTQGLKRLKRAALVAGVGALVMGGAMLATTQAHAAVTPNQLGPAGGLTISPASGSATTTTPTYNSQACPAGNQGAATLLVIDPTSAAGTAANTVNADTPAPNNLSVASAFSGSFNNGFHFATEETLGLNITVGQQFEVAVDCFQNSNLTGTQVYGGSTFVTINADGTYTADQTLGTGGGTPTNVSVALAASPSPATSGQSVTLTATVTPAAATGTIELKD